MDLSLFKNQKPEPIPLPGFSLSARQRARLRGWMLVAAGTPLLALLLLPILALLLQTSPPTLVRYLGERNTLQAIGLSLGTSTTTAIVVIVFGTPLAYLLARRRLRLRRLIEALIDLPTVLPPAVAGLALLMAFGRRGLIGSWLQAAGIEVAFTPLAVVLAQMFVAASYYVKTSEVGLAGVSSDLEQAAALDGAGPLQVFRHITLPLAWRGIVGGAALCWARAFGEFGATIIFAGNYPGRTQTMPLAVYLGFEIDLNQALTLAAILLVLSFGILITIRAILRDAPEPVC
jgi:molybdate transport system permease protein